eukprot:3626894-Pleurochrysis_carterae.AAC.2
MGLGVIDRGDCSGYGGQARATGAHVVTNQLGWATIRRVPSCQRRRRLSKCMLCVHIHRAITEGTNRGGHG